jgi:hypothetical protein
VVPLDGRSAERRCRSPLEWRGAVDEDAQHPPLHRTLSWPALAEDDLPRGTRACGVAKPIALLVLLEDISKRERRMFVVEESGWDKNTRATYCV